MLKIGDQLNSYQIAAGEPWIMSVQMRAMVGNAILDWSQRRLVLSFYAADRSRVDQIEGVYNSDETGAYFAFVRDGRFSEGLYGRSLQVELAERLSQGRAVIATGGLSIVPSADGITSFGSVIGRADSRFTLYFNAAGLIPLIEQEILPYAPLPAPLFTSDPTITSDGSPQVGEPLTGVDAAVQNLGSNTLTRAWLLDGVVKAGTSTFTPDAVGTYTFRNQIVAGSNVLASATVDVAVQAADVTPTPTPTPTPTGKRQMGINIAYPNDFEGVRQNTNLLLGGRATEYAGSGGVVADPLDIDAQGNLLRINPTYPGGYSKIVGLPYPYAATKRLRIEGPAGSTFNYKPNAANVSAANRYPASGYIADDGSGKVKYAGNKWYEVDFNWTGDPGTGPINNLCICYLEVTVIANGTKFENAFIAEVDAAQGNYISKDFWWPAWVNSVNPFAYIRSLDAALANETWYPGHPLTPATRAKPEWSMTPTGGRDATLTIGSGTSRLKFRAQSVCYDLLNGKPFAQNPDSPWHPFGARGNDMKVRIDQGTGSSCTWAYDYAARSITITLAAGGNIAAQVYAASQYGVTSGPGTPSINDGMLMLAPLSTDATASGIFAGTDAGDGSGAVATTNGWIQFSGGLDPQSRGFYSIERMVELHNLVNADMHYVFPLAATPTFATFIGDYVAKNLKPGLKFFAEGPNENWNSGFGCSKYTIQRSRGRNTYGQGASQSFTRLAAASYAEVVPPVLNAARDAWLAAGRASGDLERCWGGQHAYIDDHDWALSQAGVAAKFDTLLTAPYNAGILNLYAAPGPATWTPGTAYNTIGQCVIYNGEFYAVKAKHTAKAGQTPDTNATNYALATAVNVAPAFAAEQKVVMDQAALAAAVAAKHGLAYHTYEFGYHTLLDNGGPNSCPRLIQDIQHSDATYDTFAKFVAEFAYRHPTSRIMHLGFISPGSRNNNFGATEYLGQSLSVSPRLRVLYDFQSGTLPAYVPPVVSGFRYWRVTPTKIFGDKATTESRFGSADCAFYDGPQIIDRTGWTVTNGGADTGGNVVGRLLDGALDQSYITEGPAPAAAVAWVIDAKKPISPTIVRVYQCPEAYYFSGIQFTVEASSDGTDWTMVNDPRPANSPGYTGDIGYQGSYTAIPLT